MNSNTASVFSTISVSAICKSFDSGFLHILKDVTFEVESGQMVSILGPSGSGKSTLLHIIGLLDTPTSGSITLDGVNCSKLNESKKSQIRLNSIGFIYQFHHLLPEFSVKENLILPQLVKGTSNKKAEEEAKKTLIKVGLEDKLNRMPSELSGGEKQRVAIARAFINRPQLILADEPTGNLDQENAEKVFNIFLNETKERNLSAIIVTHNLDLAKKTDRVFVLDKGVLKKHRDFN